MPSGWKTHSAAVRTKCNSMETAIANAADTPALETLFTYTRRPWSRARPLGDLPALE